MKFARNERNPLTPAIQNLNGLSGLAKNIISKNKPIAFNKPMISTKARIINANGKKPVTKSADVMYQDSSA